MVKAFKNEDFKMARITKKVLMSLARSLNAIDLTNDHEVRKGCECLTEVAYSAGVYGYNGCILKDQDGKFFVIKDRTPALWLYGA